MLKLLLMTTKMDEGGAERYLLESIKHMEREDMHIDYYLMYKSSSADMKRQYEELNVAVYERNLNEIGGKGSLAYINDMLLFYKEYGKYDVIHVNGTAPILQLCAMFTAKLAGTKIRLVHSHSAPKNEGGFGNFINSIAKIGIRHWATHLLACSEEAGEYKYGKRGILSSKFQVMKNGIDTKKFSFCLETRLNIRKQFNWNDLFIILHVGRMSYEKNQLFLIKIVEKLYTRDKAVKLVLIGDGTDYDMLLKYVKNNKIEDAVQFMGKQNQVEDFLQGADVFCLPSLYEGFPISGLEAECTGLYSVVSNAVPISCDLTGKMQFLSLSQPDDIWMNAIIKGKNKERRDMSGIIRGKGYDINDTAAELKAIYTSTI